MIEEAVLRARELAHEHRLEGKDLDELDELEDDEDEDFLNSYRLVSFLTFCHGPEPVNARPRRKRMAELSSVSAKSVYNQVYPVQKADWTRDVTDASQQAFVFVLLTSSTETNTETRVAIEAWRELAARFGEVKFCQIRGELCIEGYPDRNTPTVLVYRAGDVVKQLVTLRELGGVRTKAEGKS